MSTMISRQSAAAPAVTFRVVVSNGKLMTADEFQQWVHRPENAERYFELERGKIIEMPPPIPWHGFITSQVTKILGRHADTCGIGFVLSNDAGVVVEQNPDTVRGPDVCYFAETVSDPAEFENLLRKYMTIPPVIAVEVLSPSDRVNRVAAKVDEYLAFGVKQVWVVDPETKDVAVHRPGQSMTLLDGDAELLGGDELPGFSCRVSDFFRLPGQKSTEQKPTGQNAP